MTGAWFKVLRKNGCWRLWDASGIVRAQRMPRGTDAPQGEEPGVVRWRAMRIEPAGSRLKGWGLTRKEAFAALMYKEDRRRRGVGKQRKAYARRIRKVEACADS
jgi:hypothetical protein